MSVLLHCGDCLEYMRDMAAGSVDAIITDLPYGTTACAWDVVIPFAPMWEAVKRVLKKNGAFVTTASQPFTSALVMSNPEWFCCEWIWNKKIVGNPFLKNYQPLKTHENIIVFGSGSLDSYNPVMTKGEPRSSGGGFSKLFNKQQPTTNRNQYYPSSIIDVYNSRIGTEHPTQKPVALYEYLIRTYTNAGEIVLDMTMGSGTTGVAAVHLGRNFIGCELDPGYFAIAQKRISEAQLQMPLLPHDDAPRPEQTAIAFT